MCVCCTLSAYTEYTEFTNYCCRLLINLDFCLSTCSVCPFRAETQAARRLCHCFVALSISCWSISSHSLLWFVQKRHNYVNAQRIFNRFCQNQITTSWHIHLRIFAESFIKFVQKLSEIYEKQMYHFYSEHGVYSWLWEAKGKRSQFDDSIHCNEDCRRRCTWVWTTCPGSPHAAAIWPGIELATSWSSTRRPTIAPPRHPAVRELFTHGTVSGGQGRSRDTGTCMEWRRSHEDADRYKISVAHVLSAGLDPHESLTEQLKFFHRIFVKTIAMV